MKTLSNKINKLFIYFFIFIIILCIPNALEAETTENDCIKFNALREVEVEGTKCLVNFDLSKNTVNDIINSEAEALGDTCTLKFYKNGYELSGDSKVGTNTVIKVMNGEEVKQEYIAIIYGDTTGIGDPSSVDALSIVKNKLDIIKFKNKIYEEAGKVTESTRKSGKEPNAIDCLAIVKYKLKLGYTINQYIEMPKNDFKQNSIDVISQVEEIYDIGQLVTIVATFSENVYANENGENLTEDTAPILKIKFGDGEEKIAKFSSSNENKITYSYEIVSGDNGILETTKYEGTLYNANGNSLEVSNIPLSEKSIKADTMAPTINYQDNGNDNYVITAGDTVTYTLVIEDENLDINSIDMNKIKINSSKVNEYEDKTENNVIFNKKEILSTETEYKLELEIITSNEIDSVGHLNIEIEEGVILDKNGRKSPAITKNYYVASLNTSIADNTIAVTVGVGNSFYIKGYTYYLNNEQKSESNRTTNEYIYDNLESNSNYDIKVDIEFYLGKSTDDTLKGTIELKNQTLKRNSGIEVHFIDVSNDLSGVSDYEKVTSVNGSGDSAFIKTSSGTTILIDTGGNEVRNKSGAKAINDYLIDNNLVSSVDGIVDIDYLIITHRDLDHMGGLYDLFGISYDAGSYKEKENKIISTKYRFKNVIFGINEEVRYNKVVEGVSNLSGNIYAIFNYMFDNKTEDYFNMKFVTAGNSITIDNCVLNIFNPYPQIDIPSRFLVDNENKTTNTITNTAEKGIRQGAYCLNSESNLRLHSKPQTEHKEENSYSVVIKVICGANKILLMGDAEFFVEEMLTGTVYNEVKNSTNDMNFIEASASNLRNKAEYGYASDKCGLLVRNSNSYYFGDTCIISTYLNLVKDIMKSEGISTKEQVEYKYKLSRLTKKDVSADILKKGHHGTRNSCSEAFLWEVKPNKIVSANAMFNTNSLIPCLDYCSDFRIRTYYAQETSGAEQKVKDAFAKVSKNKEGIFTLQDKNNYYGLQDNLHNTNESYYANWFYSVYTPCFSKYSTKLKYEQNSSNNRQRKRDSITGTGYDTTKANVRYRGGIRIETNGIEWSGFDDVANYIHNMYYYDTSLCGIEK